MKTTATVMTALFVSSLAWGTAREETQNNIHEEGREPVQDEVLLQSIQYLGSGCPAGSANAEVSPDSQSFFIFYDAFQGTLGFDAQPRDRNKACTLIVNAEVPPNTQYMIQKVHDEGSYSLASNVALKQTTKFRFQGDEQLVYTSELQGPEEGFFYEPSSEVTSLWSPCGSQRNLVITTSLVLSSEDRISRTEREGFNEFQLENSVYTIHTRHCDADVDERP